MAQARVYAFEATAYFARAYEWRSCGWIGGAEVKDLAEAAVVITILILIAKWVGII